MKNIYKSKKNYFSNWFPPNNVAFLLKDAYYQEIFDYLKKKYKFPLKMSADWDMSKR